MPWTIGPLRGLVGGLSTTHSPHIPHVLHFMGGTPFPGGRGIFSGGCISEEVPFLWGYPLGEDFHLTDPESVIYFHAVGWAPGA